MRLFEVCVKLMTNFQKISRRIRSYTSDEHRSGPLPKNTAEGCQRQREQARTMRNSSEIALAELLQGFSAFLGFPQFPQKHR